MLLLPSGQSPFLVSLMNCKVKRKILPLVLTLTGSSGSLRDASPHFLQVYKKELVFAQAGGSKTRWQSSLQVQYVSYIFCLLFLTGWPALITVLETWSKDPDWCVFSTAWILEDNNCFPESLSPQSSTQVRQTVLLMLRLTCTGLRKFLFPFIWLKRGFVTTACHVCRDETLQCIYSMGNVSQQKCASRGSRLPIWLR